jgi:glycosyltransferase involved in cell wall biosynthesis
MQKAIVDTPTQDQHTTINEIKSPLLSAIIPIRNRSGTRLLNCLHSLRWQTDIDPQNVEILIVDYGSDIQHEMAIKQAAKIVQARVKRVGIDGLWNRSRALNYGLRAAQGQYLFCTDVDMIFSPNFLSAMMNVHAQATSLKKSIDNTSSSIPSDSIVFSRCHDLPESLPLQSYQVVDYSNLLAQSTQRATQGTGACQSAHRTFFFEARGYDEAFQHWGAEDDDMRSRAIRYGLSPHWISPQASMLHQWHPTTKNQRPWRKRWNQARLYLTRWKITKNTKSWGGAP